MFCKFVLFFGYAFVISFGLFSKEVLATDRDGELTAETYVVTRIFSEEDRYRADILDPKEAHSLYRSLRIPEIRSNGGFREIRPYKRLDSRTDQFQIYCGLAGHEFMVCTVSLRRSPSNPNLILSGEKVTLILKDQEAADLSEAIPAGTWKTFDESLSLICKGSDCRIEMKLR